MRSLPLALCMMLALAVPAAMAQSTASGETGGLASSSFGTYEAGDGILSLTVGTIVPLGWYAVEAATFRPANSTPGFAFALSYAGFLTPDWALAGDLAGGFISTVNNRRLFVAPLALRAVRVFPLGQFVIAPTAGIGLAVSAIDDLRHVDGLVKLGSSFLWRATSDMSYSLNLNGSIIPQFMTDYPANSTVGFFFEATLSVAYHL